MLVVLVVQAARRLDQRVIELLFHVRLVQLTFIFKLRILLSVVIIHSDTAADSRAADSHLEALHAGHDRARIGAALQLLRCAIVQRFLLG